MCGVVTRTFLASLQSVRPSMPRDSDVVPILNVAAIVQALHEALRGTICLALS